MSGFIYAQQEPIKQSTANTIIRNFKKLDVDKNLYISKEEYINPYVKEYVENNYSLVGAHIQGETLADLLKFKQEEFMKYDTNKDGKLNIDEYTNMTRARVEREEQEQKLRENKNKPAAKKDENNAYIDPSYNFKAPETDVPTMKPL